MFWKMEVMLTAILIFVIANLALGVILWLQVRKLYSYPGRLGFPVVGNLLYFYRTLFLISLDSMEKYLVKITEKYGKNGLCFHWILGFRKMVIISSPHIVQELAFHPDLADKPEYLYRGFRIYSGRLFAQPSSDELWKIMRKDYNMGLKKSRVDRDYSTIFIKFADKLIDLMLASPSALSAHHKTSVVVPNITLGTLFGIETSLVHHPEINKVMTRMISIGSYVMANPKLAEIILTALQPIDAILFGKFNELRKLIMSEIDKPDLGQSSFQEKEQLLSRKIASRTKKYNDIKTTIIEMQEAFFTSTDTVNTSLSNSLIFLALLSDIQERAWKEQCEIFGNDSRDPTIDDLKHMQYLDRFIKESLRFVSPPLIGKITTADINIDGSTIPCGTYVIFLLKYMRMDPKYWKNPEVFDPDRFIGESNTLKHSYTPFGIGVRNCPGMYYATILLKIVLSKILRRIKLELVDKDFRFEDIQFKGSLMNVVANPPLLQVEERKRFFM